MNEAALLLAPLTRASLAFSLALLLVLAVRLPLRRRFGASAAYAAWLLVPLLLLAALLPASAPGQALHLMLPAGTTTALPAAAPAPQGSPWPVTLLALWLGGALLITAVLIQRQRRFMAALRRSPDGGHWIAPASSGPAMVGLWRARPCLPADFEQRFSTAERALILAHEDVHRRRHDNAWNLLATALATLQWFNPLVWLALRLMRADQELSCDAAVLRHHADQLTHYASALLAAQHPPLAAGLPWSSWRSAHPLVERIAMLKLHSTARRQAGLRTLALLGLLGAGGVHALQSAAPAEASEGRVRLDMKIEILSKTADGTQEMRRMDVSQVVALGREITVGLVAQGSAPATDLAFSGTEVDAERFKIAATVSQGEPRSKVAQPRLITANGVKARIEMGNPSGGTAWKFDLTPTRVPADTPLGRVR